ncbi:glycerol-3-phosphate dehydrogenase [Halanaerobium congolense]|uniref:Glycerol-3-phosphate dehydrogenase n=1 Tax=Halanaerobium congolense TaxID=54121 RepID=A0A4R8GQW1_9FIRM|nr:NAD(P)/FAD-dependent oxidoreductase [Halanaerobium congolense]TDS33122.1 glycerol-3-phosphate dehydrogenase [Halanaerobium congolense]TDX48205.1 glycerol-3-phosphate dehydrogenase [Halanaerobium congolense]
MNKKYDVIIIGGGVTGCFIARELSRYDLNIALVEKEPDVCTGTSKANTALIHAGFNADSNKLKGRLNVRGNKLYHERVQHELDVPIEWLGAMVVAEDEADIPKLEAILENGQKNDVPDLEIVKGDRLYELEPHLSEDAVAALYAPTAGIVNPFELTVALANNAARNGVDVFLEAEVEDIEDIGDHKLVKTVKGEMEAGLVINAAGLYADKIANMVGIDKFKITPRRGEYYLYDKKMELNLQKTIFPVPTEVSKGIVVTPTDERNVLIGPNAEEIDNVENKSTTRKGLDKVMEGANKTVPGLSKKGIIREFVGLRPAIKETGDFLIEASDEVSGFINVAGIQSPGLASSPAIAEMVVGIVKEELGDLNEKSDFDPNYQGPPKFRHMTHAEQAKLVEENPDYGQIICRCETVTKGEILDIIREPVGARTVNAVKRRARPGAGRCQGGFCEPKVVSILAEELGIEENEVCLESAKSKLLKEKTKAPLLKEVAK